MYSIYKFYSKLIKYFTLTVECALLIKKKNKNNTACFVDITVVHKTKYV